MKNLILFLISTLFIVGCTTYPHSTGRSQYIKVIDASSAGDKQFSGLYDNFEFHATLLRRSTNNTVLKRMEQIYDWDQEKVRAQQEKSEKFMAEKTRVWLSFFTPSSKDDNIDKKDSIWKIYLTVDGQRHEAKVKKIKQNLAEASELYPYHNRWGTVYHLDFSIPTDRLQGRQVELIITGPLGRRQVHFP